MASADKKERILNPFPGLRPFNSDDKEYFYGREFESEEIAGKLLRNRFIAVTGASGSGKSSLVNCGLIPKLIDISSKEAVQWHIFNMRPGNNPFHNLSRSISGNNDEQSENILSLLRNNNNGLDLAFKHLYRDIGNKVLLIIDQFEDLFRFPLQESGSGHITDTDQFIDLITNALAQGSSYFHLAITLRSDFLTECEKYRGITDHINNSSFLVSRMKRENIRQAIVQPVLNAGAEINNDLVELLLDEVNERADQLPVLQHALMRTWIHWNELNEPERPIDFSDYSSVGTMKDAISRHADEVYFGLSQQNRKICESLFKLITGKGSDNKGMRYPSSIRTIKMVIRCTDEDLMEVIEKFREPSISFLIPYYYVPINDDSVLDLSHESLINLWDRLKRWIDEESYSAQVYQRLSDASALYQQGKTGLLKPPDLQLAINWRNENEPTLWWAQKYNPAFERAMVYLRTSEKEYIESEERKAKRSRWRIHKIKIISSILGGIAILAGLFMVTAIILKMSSDNRRKLAENQKQEIELQKEAAEKIAAVTLERSIESDSNAVAAFRIMEKEQELRKNVEGQLVSKQSALNKTIKQYDSAAMAARLAISETDSVTELKNETQRLRMISLARSMSLRSVQMDEQEDLQALLAYQAYLFNRSNRGSKNDADVYKGLYTLAKMKGSNKIKTFGGMESPLRSIVFVPGKKEFFASDSYGRIIKWDLSDEKQSFNILHTGDEIIDVLAVSPDANWLACGGSNSNIKMIPLAMGGQDYDLKGHAGGIKSLIFSYDGKFLYSAALDGQVLKWDLAAHTSTDVSTGGVQITSIDLSLNNRFLAGISDQGDAYIWEPEDNSDKFTIESKGKKIKNIRFKPDEERIAVGYDDGIIELWDIGRREKILEFQAHRGEINDIRFNSKFSQMATAGDDGLLKLWDTSDFINPPVIFNDNEGIVISIDFSSDGEIILAGSISNHSRIISRPAYADSFATDGCTYVTRNFTPDEWQAYVGKDITYEKTCPGADLKIKIREIR
jgi:WD40 repeat protein